jgi:hypothetical protein
MIAGEGLCDLPREGVKNLPPVPVITLALLIVALEAAVSFVPELPRVYPPLFGKKDPKQGAVF